MAAKKIGISRELLIHPGETIAEVLEERGISQAELAAGTGVSTAYVCNVIAGKKDISARFAYALEYVLGVPKSFWLNLQAHYDAQLLEVNEAETITEAERIVREALKEVVQYLRRKNRMPMAEKKDASILSLRKALQVSNLANLRTISEDVMTKQGEHGRFHMAAQKEVNPYVLGAWVRMCQIAGQSMMPKGGYREEKSHELIQALKNIMLQEKADVYVKLQETFSNYGICFSIAHSFQGAPVYGYVARKREDVYQLVLTIRDTSVDSFWFALFHEIGHVVNGDIGKSSRFVDNGDDELKELEADLFARNKLIAQESYSYFLSTENLEIESIKRFAASQNVLPYIVIGRLQKEKKLANDSFSEYNFYYNLED